MTCSKRLFNVRLVFAIALVAQSWSIANAQTPEIKPRPTASVTGRVTIGEKPAPGVIVAATTANYPQLLVVQTVSDADGKYRLSGLTPGQISVSAVAPTFVMPSSPMSFMQGRVLNLSTDEAVEGIDFKLTRGGVITGRVIDSEGKPVMEERLTLTLVDEKGEPVRNTMPVRAANPSAMSTDDRGIYRIYGLAAGRYKVSAGDNGGGGVLRSGYYPRTYHPDTPDVTKAAIVELSEGGEVKNIDITLGPRARTYVVSGRFVDADTGEPIAGINFAFGMLQQNQNQSFLAGYSSPGRPTNPKGEFRLEGIAPGRYAVTTISNSFPMTPDQPKFYGDPVPFEVTDGDVTDVEVKARRALTISGVIVSDGMSKAGLSGLSRLMVSGYVEAAPSSIQVFSGGTSSPIAADGSFQLDGLRPGKLTLSVIGTSPALSKGYSVSRVTTDHEWPNRQIELAPGQNISGVRVFVSYGTGVIKGEIKFEGGSLPSDAIMFVAVRRENSQVTSAQVDARGRFAVMGVPAGTFEVMLQIVTLGPTANLPNSLPRMLRQTVTVSDDSETQVTFTLNVTPKDKP